jgi:RNA polymerase sigma-70 factor, ECF subfamily
MSDMTGNGAGVVRADEEFVELRPLLFSIAYRMLGSITEAEDMVQDAFLRWRRAAEEGAEVDSAKSYLAATVTRLAIDHLRRAKARRETYVGPWLPEPPERRTMWRSRRRWPTQCRWRSWCSSRA